MTRHILSIDTCGSKYSIAVLSENRCIASFISDEKNMQCEKLVTSLEQMLSANSMSYSDIDLIAVTAGPGSFNGVRIGFAAAQGISIATNIPITTVSTLEVVLHQYIQNQVEVELRYPIYVCFKADVENCFIHKFDNVDFTKAISDPIPSTVREVELLRDNSLVIDFSLQNYDNESMPNAVSAGVIALKRETIGNAIFYGKPPSIHKKNGSMG